MKKVRNEMSKKVNPHIRLITMGLLLVIWSSTTAAETIFVDANAPPAGGGNSWPTAYNYLQDGLADATLGDQIRVANGTYRPDQDAADPDGSNSTSATFTLIDGVGLYGGYAGFGAPDPNHRDIQQYETTLTGTLDGGNSFHVVTTGTGISTTTVIDGFTITGGHANTSGGGMYNNPGSPTVVNCFFRGNSANVYGGGMYNNNNSPVLTDCTFTGNSADKYGGGLYNQTSSPEITNCTFTQNSSLERGGGICNYSNSNPEVTDCRFTGNSSTNDGGGIYNRSSSPDIVNCIFTGNSSTNDGGGMYNYSADPQVVNCTFSGNYADISGAMHNDYSDPQVTNCTFAGNWAISNGGGMSNYNNSYPDITNCTFSTNWTVGLSSLGGGMYSNGGIQTVTNCIFWANEDSSGLVGPAQIQGGSPQVTYSCIQDDDPNDGDIPFDDANIDDNPMFVRDPNAGGDGWGDDPCTPGVDEAANDDYGDLHLLSGSPCIDAGDNTMVPADTHDLDDDLDTSERTPLDLDYDPRFIDDPLTPDTGQPALPDDPNIVDMGAYEFAPQPPQGMPGDIDLDGDVDLVDFVILSNQWQDVPGQPSADIAPPGGDGTVNSDDLLIVAANWLAGT
jgi:predicted outer membrane repeat protein